MEILILGITGAVGSILAPRLLAAGHTVRGLSRSPLDLRAHPELAGVDHHCGDAVAGTGLDRVLDGVDVAYYLIHSMERQAGSAFPEHESRAVEHYAAAAAGAGVRRTLYLGGPVPPGEVPSSPHLASRLAVEKVLLESTPEALAFRASIVIGASSRSFRFLVRLIERLPVLVLPDWRDNASAPIDERDVTAFLLAGASVADIGTRALDIAGPETVSYRELIERIRDLMLIPRPTLGLPHLTLTPITSRVAAVIAGEDPAFIEPIMESLDSDLPQDGAEAAALLGVRRHSLDAAIERALANWESQEELAAR